MKKIENKNLNNIVYLKDENDFAMIIDKLRNKIGLSDSEIEFLILEASKGQNANQLIEKWILLLNI